MKFGRVMLFPKFVRQSSEIWMMIFGLMVALVITNCSTESSSTTYLPSDLEKFVRQDAVKFFATTGMESLRLETVTQLTINDIRNPTSEPNAALGLAGKEMWCLTTVAQGTQEGVSHEVSMQWFGFKQEGKDWSLIPRHIVAYPAFWDDACDQAKRLDS